MGNDVTIIEKKNRIMLNLLLKFKKIGRKLFYFEVPC